MKIHILKEISDCIDGYNPIFVENNTVNLDVPNNSINSIIMVNTIEEISHRYIDDFIHKIRQLLRINGTLLITGIDVNCLSRDLINGVIDCTVYNEIVYQRKAVYDCKELSEKLNELGIKVDKILLKGSSYELHAVRSN